MQQKPHGDLIAYASHAHANTHSRAGLSGYQTGVFLKLLTSTEKVNLDVDVLHGLAGIKVKLSVREKTVPTNI